MLTKHNQLTGKKTALVSIVIVLGNQPFQSMRIIQQLKQQWLTEKGKPEGIQIIDIESDTDWSLLQKKAYQQDLFSEATLIDVRYNKKNLDAKGKAFFSDYIETLNPYCTLIFQAPEISSTIFKTWHNHPHVHIMVLQPPSKATIIQWIHQRLMQCELPYDPAIPELLWEYTENNLIATDQSLEKITLFSYQQTELTLSAIKDLLFYQCHYSPYALSDTCLEGNSIKTIELLSLYLDNKTEPTLLLWVLSQDIRHLVQIQDMVTKGSAETAAFKELKLWPSRIPLYRKALMRCQPSLLTRLLAACQRCDLAIKKGNIHRVWHLLDNIALTLSQGSPVGYLE